MFFKKRYKNKRLIRKTIWVRVLPEEKEIIQQYCNRNNVSMSAFLRKLGLHKIIEDAKTFKLKQENELVS